MPDPVARLRAMNRPYEACSVPDRAVLASRATRRVLRGGTASLSAVTGAVVLALCLSAPGDSRSLQVTTTPAPSPTATASSPAPRPGRTLVPRPAPLVATPRPAPARLVTSTPTPAPVASRPAARLRPSFWHGGYGDVPFYQRQIVRSADNNFCVDRAAIQNLPPGINGGSCSLATAMVGVHRDEGLVAEFGVCMSPDGKDYSQAFDKGKGENELVIYDAATRRAALRWSEPPAYVPRQYTLGGGDCVFYLWHLALRTAKGEPLVAGREYFVRVSHNGGDRLSDSDTFVVP